MIDRPDPLDAPLGQTGAGAERKAASAGPRWGWMAAGPGMAGSVAVVAAPEPKAPGGRPQAVATIEKVAPPPAAPPPAQTAAPASAGAAMATSGPSIAQIEASSGVKVNRPPGMNAPGALIIQVPQAGGAGAAGRALAPAPESRVGEETPPGAFVEKSPHGPLPKIGADGSKPSEIYARPVIVGSSLKPGAPRVALYVDGLGLAGGPTQAAIALPPAVTLAFAAVGEDLARQAQAARAAGHEILLQAPMEPADYPATDPGPDTLLASAPGKNIDRLHAMMARLAGYVGVSNYRGGRFLADEAALARVLGDLAGRGLLFVEDGEGPLAASLAGRFGLKALRADVVIDRGDGAEGVRASLDRLEALARERGAAIGAASALPGALAQIKRWAEGLEGRGIALAPLSSMAVSAPGPAPRPATQRKK